MRGLWPTRCPPRQRSRSSRRPVTIATLSPARRELTRADVQAELTKRLLHGYGTLTIKIHDHRITVIEATTRLLEGQGEEA